MDAGDQVAVPVAAAAGGAAAARAPAAQAVARGIVTWAGSAGAGGARRVAWAAALVFLGSAAAGLALFAMTLPGGVDIRVLELGDLACKPTQADVVALRTASQSLLLAATAQVIAATLAVLVPVPLVAVFAYIVGWFTVDRATDVLWMLVACHDSSAHDVLSSDYHFIRLLLYVALAVGTLVSLWWVR